MAAAGAAAAEVKRSRSTKTFHSPNFVLFARYQLGRRKLGELIWIK